MELQDYQRTAVDKLNQRIMLDWEEGDTSQQVLKTITGLGKTAIFTALINEMANLGNHNVCFLWVTPSKNGAQKSYDSLKNSLTGHRVSMLSDEFSGDRDSIGLYEVVVFNWGKINRKGNLLMREGEKYSFPDVIENTKASGLKIVLIVDNSHRNLDTIRSEEIVAFIDPDAIICASDTPTQPPTVVIR